MAIRFPIINSKLAKLTFAGGLGWIHKSETPQSDFKKEKINIFIENGKSEVLEVDKLIFAEFFVAQFQFTESMLTFNIFVLKQI